MKTLKILFTAIVAVCLASCIKFKVEATVDVTVVKNGQIQPNVEVYRFNDGLGESTTMYKSNSKDMVVTNEKGVAHFELRSPDDLDPSDVGLTETKTFYFATYDKNEDRNGLVSIAVTSGDKKQVKLEIQDSANPSDD